MLRAAAALLLCTTAGAAGVGMGVGMGYTDCKYEFDAIDKAVAARKAAQPAAPSAGASD